MTEKLPPITKMQLGAIKHRAVLKMVDQLQQAYIDASARYDMTRAEFAARIGMKPSQFSRILNGRQNITVEMAEAVLRAFEARGIYSHEFLDDISIVSDNRVGSRYQKRGVVIDGPDGANNPYKVSVIE